MRLDVSFPPSVVQAVGQARAQAVVYLPFRTGDRTVIVDGAQAAAQAAAALGARFLYVSTDLVFDGERAPYAETAPAQPLMPYGRLKLEGEVAVRDAHPEAVVLRPSLFAGESGELLYPRYEGSQLTAGLRVNGYVDEWRTPVLAEDVARAIWQLVLGDAAGTYHLGGPERLTRHALALRLCTLFGFPPSLVREARRPADRPRDTALDSRRLVELLGWAPRSLTALAPRGDLAGV